MQSYIFLVENNGKKSPSAITSMIRDELDIAKIQSSVIAHHTIPQHVIIRCAEPLTQEEHQLISNKINNMRFDNK